MTYKIILIGIITFLFFSAPQSAWAMGDDESQINLYSSQKINVNKKPKMVEVDAPTVSAAQPQTFVVTEDYYNPPPAVKEEESKSSIDNAPFPAPVVEEDKADILGPDDQINITVVGEDDLSGEFIIMSDHTISFPLIGNINVRGKSLHQIEQHIIAKLKDGYINDPIVSIEIIEDNILNVREGL